MPGQFYSPMDKVDVDLTAAERKLILEEIYIFDTHLLRPIEDASRGKPVEMLLDDVDDLANYINARSQLDGHKDLRTRLQKLVRKLRDLLASQAAEVQSSQRQEQDAPELAFPISYSASQRRAIAERIPELAERLRLQEPNSRVVNFTLAELRHIKKQARRAVGSVNNGMQRNSLATIIEATCEVLEKYQEGRIGRISSSKRVYQLRISISDISPEIWRRIQVKECTLDRLHEHIQLAFGWWNYHLHQFLFAGRRYGDPWLLDDGFEDCEIVDSTTTKLSDIVPRDGKRYRFKYKYDFGDGWEHEVLFEGCIEAKRGERYPLCLEGERASPPEDVGGVYGYARYCEVMADPKHEEHDGLMAWRGAYDPKAFDPVKTTKNMRRGMPKPEYDEP
ncbi:MAG: plasmid pRiA4b ORF-3 family protein [Planctomycetia bacterium]|nr:plasmid pRiA4b ORF-3 family protein [Planctomycetia bacterium]